MCVFLVFFFFFFFFFFWCTIVAFVILQKLHVWKKIWFLSYRQKCSWSIRFWDFLNFSISKAIWGMKSFFFLHGVNYLWKLQVDCLVYFGCGQACLGMPKVLRNNILAIFLERFELFCWFVACSQTFMEATIWSCVFYWV